MQKISWKLSFVQSDEVIFDPEFSTIRLYYTFLKCSFR